MTTTDEARAEALAEVIRAQASGGQYQMPGDRLPYEAWSRMMANTILAAGYRKVEVTDDKAIAAIATIEFSRQTHVEWRDWLRAHPEDKRGEVTGDADYHDKTIHEYDNVLAVLAALGGGERKPTRDEANGAVIAAMAEIKADRAALGGGEQ